MSDPFTGYRVNVFNPIVSREDYAALHERHTALVRDLEALEQDTRRRGERACLDVKPPYGGWSAIEMSTRSIGAVLVDIADRLATVLADHRESQP